MRNGDSEILDTSEEGALMKHLDSAGQQIKNAEIERAFSREKLASLPEESREEVRLLVHRVINKMCATAVRHLSKLKNSKDRDVD